MAKMDALKEKMTQARAGLAEKMDKIAFIRKWREQRTVKGPGATPHSMGDIYRGGGVITRLQVILVYVFAIAALASTVYAVRKMMARFATKEAKIEKEYSHGLGDLANKAVEKANLVSLGKFTAGAYTEGKAKSLMVVDVWIRVSDPDTAAYAQSHETVIYDRVVEALNEAYQEKIDPLTEEGATITKSKVQESINHAMPKGRVEEIFFQNLVIQ